MHRSRYWALLGVAGVAVLVLAITMLEAQRPFPAAFFPEQVGRYQAIKIDGDTIILLDTATGDLYKAGRDDIKPYRDRPRIGVGAPPPTRPAFPPPPTASPPPRT
jgi:hypothetical protein